MCNVSPYGVGAVLSQIDAHGIERAVVYASRTLSQPEKNCSQLEKEALALVFGTKRFHYIVSVADLEGLHWFQLKPPFKIEAM